MPAADRGAGAQLNTHNVVVVSVCGVALPPPWASVAVARFQGRWAALSQSVCSTARPDSWPSIRVQDGSSPGDLGKSIALAASTWEMVFALDLLHPDLERRGNTTPLRVFRHPQRCGFRASGGGFHPISLMSSCGCPASAPVNRPGSSGDFVQATSRTEATVGRCSR